MNFIFVLLELSRENPNESKLKSDMFPLWLFSLLSVTMISITSMSKSTQAMSIPLPVMGDMSLPVDSLLCK